MTAQPTVDVHETLSAALVAAQAEMPAVEADAVNPHFRSKFVSLGNLVAKTRPVLNRHGIAVVQFPSQDENGKPTLVTELVHGKSGERMGYPAPLMLPKADPQGQGSAITYMRRYAWAAALGIVDQEDDDGNAATAAAVSAATNGHANPAPPAGEPVTKKRAADLVAIAFDIGCQDKLQLAASHAHGEDVGDCSTKTAAADAIAKLTVPQADKVEVWLQKKADEVGAEVPA